MSTDTPAPPSRPRTVRRWAIALATTTALVLVVVCAGAWWNTSRGAEQHFDSCAVENGVLVLSWVEGSGDEVSTTLHRDGDEITVQLRVKSPSGVRTAVGLIGTARYALPGGPFTVRHTDGTPLDCPQRAPRPTPGTS